MSSVSFKKCHAGTGEGAAMLAHATRHEGRENVNYRNKNLHPELSHLNTTIGHLENHQTTTTLEWRVAEIDKLHPPKRIKSDRVTMMSYTIAAPEGLPRDREEDFFRIVHDEIAKMSGGHSNVTKGFIHRDEINVYRDPDSKQLKTSRVHMHMMGVPFVEGVGINGKQFETRARMQALNREIDSRCRRELGVRFLTGATLAPDRKGRTVEELKRQTETYNDLDAQIDRARKDLSALKSGVLERRAEIDALQTEKAAIEANLAALRAEKERKAREARNKVLRSIGMPTGPDK